MMKKHVAIVRKRSELSSDIATDVMSWKDFGKVRGFMDFLTITKGEVVQKVVSDSTHIFVCETNLDIETGDRLHVNGKEYEVNFVDRPMYGKQAEIELKPILQINESESIIYFGISDEKDIIETDVLGFANQTIKARKFTKVIEVDTDSNFVISYPKSLGKASIRLNNKPIMDWEINEIMVNGTINYVYSVKVKQGSLTIDLF